MTKFALAKEHREFYAHHHYIEFEELLSKEDSEILRKKTEEILTARIKPASLASRTAHELYLAGRDLWRDDLILQKIVFKRTLSEVAAALFKQSFLRVAFDQYQDEIFPLSLQQMSCLTPLVGALALPLDEKNEGKGIYFSSTKPLSLPFCNSPLLIIAYTGKKTQYIFKETDFHTHVPKKLGYGFGDLITNETHPILFR